MCGHRYAFAMAMGLIGAAAVHFPATQAFAAGGDAAAGRQVFARCAACHSTAPGESRLGPSLEGVFGRKSGTGDGYAYSSALRNAGIVWDDATLDKYLRNPAGFVHGTKMFVGFPNADSRRNVIAYLKELSR